MMNSKSIKEENLVELNEIFSLKQMERTKTIISNEISTETQV